MAQDLRKLPLSFQNSIYSVHAGWITRGEFLANAERLLHEGIAKYETKEVEIRREHAIK